MRRPLSVPLIAPLLAAFILGSNYFLSAAQTPSAAIKKMPDASVFASSGGIVGLDVAVTNLIKQGRMPHAAAIADVTVDCGPPNAVLSPGTDVACGLYAPQAGGALLLLRVLAPAARRFSEDTIGSQINMTAIQRTAWNACLNYQLANIRACYAGPVNSVHPVHPGQHVFELTPSGLGTVSFGASMQQVDRAVYNSQEVTPLSTTKVGGCVAQQWENALVTYFRNGRFASYEYDRWRTNSIGQPLMGAPRMWTSRGISINNSLAQFQYAYPGARWYLTNAGHNTTSVLFFNNSKYQMTFFMNSTQPKTTMFINTIDATVANKQECP